MLDLRFIGDLCRLHRLVAAFDTVARIGFGCGFVHVYFWLLEVKANNGESGASCRHQV